MGVRNRRARKHARTHIVGFGIAGVLGFLALLVIALAISAGALVNSWLLNLPDYQSADAYLVAEPTQVVDADNNVIAEYYLQNRRIVTKDEVSPYVLWGTVDTEDIRFYQHNGIDPQGIARAVLVQFTGGSEGASTITQQLVRNTVLSNEQFEQTLKRKVREAYIAIQMEKMYTKDQILMMYLNTIYFGDGAYGIQAASINYFNKNASDLTLAEAALLAGLPQAPSAYDPTVNPEGAVWRRNVVLSLMLEGGDITQEEYDAAKGEELVLNHGDYPDSVGRYPYFSDYVRELLLEDFDSNTILQGGLHVYTTVDPTWQQYAEEAVAEQLEYLGDDQLQFGFVALDTHNAYVKAMVGGRDYNISQFNTATQARRQVGSSFKTFVLACAVQDGMNPDIYLNGNSPLQITDEWEVQNYGGASYGTVSLKAATQDSLNTPYAQVAMTLGIENVIQTSHDMGISVDLPPYPSVALGSAGIPPIDMAEGYCTLAADGMHRDAVAITRIEDRNGNVVYEHKDNPTQVLDPAVAEAVTEVLESVCTYGHTGSAVLNYSINQPIAGKTGTTNDARDLWFCGYTPQVCCAVWCGYLEEQRIYVFGYEGQPGRTSTPVFGRFAEKLLAGTEYESFPNCGYTPEYKDNSEWVFSNTDSAVNSGYYYYNWYTDTDTTDETEETEETYTEDTYADDSSYEETEITEIGEGW